ncbi:MAG: OmpW/AlkL family protein [Gammaproteobacteria bacterium]|nr:OmpW family outer membrane protein [Gammaproteobacteria bacterium]
MRNTRRRTGIGALWMLAVLLSVAAGIGLAHAQGERWMVRLRGVVLVPNDSSGVVSTLPGSGVSVSTDAIPELDISYFFRPRWSAELILGSSQHDISGQGSIAGLGKIADARTLPPTLTLQYHFLPGARVQPYLGLGVNYTDFYAEQASPSLNAALGTTSVHLDSSLGVAAQLGADFALGGGWFANMDLKYIDLGTTAILTSPGAVRRVDVQIDPWLVGFGIGRRF